MNSDQWTAADEQRLQLMLKATYDVFVVLNRALSPAERSMIEARGIRWKHGKYPEVTQASAADLVWLNQQDWFLASFTTLTEAMTFDAITSGVGLAEKVEQAFGPAARMDSADHPIEIEEAKTGNIPSLPEGEMTMEDTANVQGGAAAHGGYAQRFERRPAFEIWNTFVPEVVDAAWITQRTTPDELQIIRIADLFSGDDETLIGFGKPNTFMVVPKDPNDQKTKSPYLKLAVKSLWRAPTKIEDTRGWVQSGVFMRLLGLPEDARVRLRLAMKKYEGQKFATCARGVATVLEEAGFSSGAEPLSKHTWPEELLRSIFRNGLSFDGQPVQKEVISTKPEDLTRYTWGICRAELATLGRHCSRSLDSIGKKNKVFGGIVKLIKWPAKKLFKKTVVRCKTGPIAPALPQQNYVSDIRVRVSKASMLGCLMRIFWDAHSLFEAAQDRVNPTDYLKRIMPAFPQPNPDLATRLKKKFLFSKLTIKLIRKILVSSYVEMGALPENKIFDMLRTDGEGAPNKYNIVITRTHIIIARINIFSKLIDWILSKHVLISGYDPEVLFAGETWKVAIGAIYLNRNSGTYQPLDEELDAALEYLRAVFPHFTFVKG